MTLIYKIKEDGINTEVRYLHYHKKEDFFTFIMPAIEAALLRQVFTLCVKDLITDSYSEENCFILDRLFFDTNNCKITFKVRSKGAYFLQDAIANNSYMED